MAGVLSAEQVWVETFTELRLTQFSRLLKAVRERGGNGTMQVFGVSSSTVYRGESNART